MAGPEGQLTEYTNADPTVFISDVELTLSPSGRVNGNLARKVIEISSRAIWYDDYDAIVLPEMPDPRFVDYAAELGREPQIVVPANIRPESVSIYDGFGDQAFQAVIGNGAWSESYMGDRTLWAFVTSQGGRYGGGDPGFTVDFVNDKANFQYLTDHDVASPPGVLATGTAEISAAISQQLLRSGQVFVRHTRSGGGLGNRRFELNGHAPTLDEIAAKLEGDQPDQWRNGQALVEEYLSLAGSPSVSFRAGRGMAYASFQVTHDNEFTGHWSPLPSQIWDPEDIRTSGDKFSKKLGELGFWGWAGVDLGIGPNRQRWGFEFNGRTVGSRHAVDIGERLFGQPWGTWSEAGIVVKGIDHFVLSHEADFQTLHSKLGSMGCLATRDNPVGVIITIPPAGRIAGIQVNGIGYRQVEVLYQKVLAEVGDNRDNNEDHPLLDNPLMKGSGY